MGFRGRPIDRENLELYAKAAALKAQGLTNAQITQKLLPNDYADPIRRESAADKIRKGIDRYSRKRRSQKRRS